MGQDGVCLAGFSCKFRANFERKRARSLIGRWTDHHFHASLIGREAAIDGGQGVVKLETEFKHFLWYTLPYVGQLWQRNGSSGLSRKRTIGEALAME
jgi:hypothetical protein